MADPFDSESQACLLVYDGQCRLCVTAKKGLERLGTYADATPIRMVPYQSEEAKQALGERYRPGRPNVAFLVRPNGEIAGGLDAFLALLPGLKGGRVLSALLSFPLGQALRLSAVLVCSPVSVLRLWQSSTCVGFRESR
jgi:predicted DCC family thiol-disulfide oxidoreductase YuxK